MGRDTQWADLRYPGDGGVKFLGELKYSKSAKELKKSYTGPSKING